MLTRAGSESPALCARVLLEFCASFSRTQLILAYNQIISPQILDHYYNLIKRRKKGEPLAYIIGKKEFYGRNFIVNKTTLIPRPETELLIDLALANFPQNKCFFLDACCGSGCIGITLLLERPFWKGILMDNSDCIKTARENASLYNKQAKFIMGDIFSSSFKNNLFDLVISNPPYIAYSDQVMKCVFDYEPHSALFSQNNGVSHIAAVISLAANVLKNNGILIMEHGSTQQGEILYILNNAGFKKIQLIKDFSERPRAIMAGFSAE